MKKLTSLKGKTSHKNATNYSINCKHPQSAITCLALGGIPYA